MIPFATQAKTKQAVTMITNHITGCNSLHHTFLKRLGVWNFGNASISNTFLMSFNDLYAFSISPSNSLPWSFQSISSAIDDVMESNSLRASVSCAQRKNSPADLHEAFNHVNFD